MAGLLALPYLLVLLGYGLPACGRLVPHGVERLLASIVVGTVVAGHLVFVLAVVGGITAWSLAGVAALGLFGAFVHRGDVRCCLAETGDFLRRVLLRADRWQRPFAAALVALLLWLVLLATVPPRTADAMRYHLAQMEDVVRHGELVFRPYWHYNLPMAFKLAHLPVYVTAGGEAVQVASLLQMLLAGVAMLRLATRLGLEQSRTMTLLLLLTPAAFVHGTTAQDDWPVVAAVTTGLLLLASRASRELSAADLLPFACLGAGLATKHQAVLLAPWFVVLAVRRSRATPQALGARLGYAAAGVVLAFALASPTYVRNWVYLDNPVWPQLIRVFNDPSASPHAMGVAYTEQFSGSHSVGAVVGALQRQARSSVVPAALWVAALGGLLLAGSRALAPGWGLLTFAVAWWVLQPRMFPRFATYVVPILVIYTAILAPCLGRRWPRMATLTRVGVGVLLVGEVLAASVYSGGLLSYHWHRDLSVYHRATYFYEQYQWINAHLPDDAKVAVIARSQTFRLDRDYVRAEPAYSGLIDWRRVRDPADLASRLGRLGVTHVFFEPRRHRFFLGGSTVDEVVPGLVEEGLADVVRHWQGVRLYSFRTLGVYQETEVWLMALRAGP